MSSPTLARATDFDCGGLLLNTPSGTVDLAVGKLRRHDPAQLLTRITSVPFEPDAKCPGFEGFLATIMDGDADKVDFLSRALGYSLTADTSEQCLFLPWGGGANGKTTLLEVVRCLMKDYAMSADPSTFLARRDGSARPDIARLLGARLVTSVETEEGVRLAESQVKQLTGGDTITARHLYREPIEFKPTLKLWLAANHKPVIRGTDDAIWRRIALIPFPTTIPEQLRERNLTDRLARDEGPGILAYLVRACLRWQRHGLGRPHAVDVATNEYRDEMDPLTAWLEEQCEVGPRLVGTSLYSAYQEWATENDQPVMPPRRFREQMERRGFSYERRRGRSRFVGVGLSRDATTQRDAASASFSLVSPSRRESYG